MKGREASWGAPEHPAELLVAWLDLALLHIARSFIGVMGLQLKAGAPPAPAPAPPFHGNVLQQATIFLFRVGAARHTKETPDGIRVAVLPTALCRAREAVAVSQAVGAVQGDPGKHELHDGCGNPPHSCGGVSQGEHTSPNDSLQVLSISNQNGFDRSIPSCKQTGMQGRSLESSA